MDRLPRNMPEMLLQLREGEDTARISALQTVLVVTAKQQ